MTSLYIHIPFCKKKCNYCDFVSYAGKEELIDEYAEALCKEISSIVPPLSSIVTIYFGGGTPTLFEPRHFEAILKNVRTTFMVVRNERTGINPVPTLEITTEANPGTADRSKLKKLRKLGINRISIGAQSFNDQHLKTLGRIHNSEEIFRFYEDARSAGFDNINLDLIFALPNQTLEEWKKDLQTAVNLNPSHLSTYNLQIEENTPFWKKINSEFRNPNSEIISNFQFPISNFQLPDEETELAMYEHAIETLIASGYTHYEISNFAKPKSECRHNVNYWKNGNYIGIGAGAHSHIDGKRWANPSNIEDYIKDAERKTQYDSHDATAQRDTLFLGLRLLEGLPADKFHGFEKEVTELIETGLLAKEKSNVKLSRKGLYLANEVFAEFV